MEELMVHVQLFLTTEHLVLRQWSMVQPLKYELFSNSYWH